MKFSQRRPESHEHWKVVDVVDSTYWSGLDVEYFIDNIRLDDAIQISYQVTEQTRPYYGYSSYVADRIHHGARLISGELTVNLKHTSHMHKILDMVRAGASTASFPDITWEENIEEPTLDNATISVDTRLGPASGLFWADPDEVWRKGQSIRGRLPFMDLRALPDMHPVVSRDMGVFETRRDGFELRIVFGGKLVKGHKLVSLENGMYETQGVVREELGVVGSTGVSPKHGIAITGVSFGASAQTISDDGRGIVETYSFMGKNIYILRPEEIV